MLAISIIQQPEVRFMNKKGVTLVELIVVMVIIGIASALLIPNVGAWLPNYRLRTSTREIVSAMRMAQMKAVSTNMPYRVSFAVRTLPKPSRWTYVLQYEDPPLSGTWVTEGSTKVFSSSIYISFSLSSGKNALFNPNSSSSSGSLTVRNSHGTERQIRLTPSTGRVMIQ
jgi:prepilin-type N-terminal cleavage/methylation domain-containing protein